jgi:hypothetical protein
MRSEDNEPNMYEIDDYNNNESPEKRNTVRMIILGLILICAVFAALKLNMNSVDDYVGTPDKPGINTAR